MATRVARAWAALGMCAVRVPSRRHAPPLKRNQRLAMYIVISKPKRKSVKAGVVHCMLSSCCGQRFHVRLARHSLVSRIYDVTTGVTPRHTASCTPPQALEPMRINPRSLSPVFTLALPERAQMRVQQRGPEGGQPWLSLHGGPGSGAGPSQFLPFAPEQRVLAPDQRGAGGSRPRGQLRGNSLAALVADLERLRAHMGWAQWSVLGGSWGATLALAYAAQHPERVSRLVLRGTFDGRRQTVNALFFRRPPGSARQSAGWFGRPPAPGVWHKLLQVLHFGTITVQQRALLQQWQTLERQALLRGMSRAHRAAPTPSARVAIHRQRLGLRKALRQRGAPSHVAPRAHWRALRDTYRIQAHYFAHACFIQPGQWAAWLHTLLAAGMPMDLVHGRFDRVCPMAIASNLAAQVPHAKLSPTTAGHLGLEPETARRLGAVVRESRA